MACTLETGVVLDARFELVQPLGQGAVGTVWLAKDVHLDNDLVACKFLNEHLAEDRQAVSDFKREVLITRRLRHPNILGVYTFWELEGFRFISMEYIDGASFANALAERDRPFPLDAVLAWAWQLGDALDYAHSRGVLHRDVKPANILLDNEGRAHLADFGIARLAEDLCAGAATQRHSGTLLYASPEQIRGAALNPRSDQYSLAATLFQMVAGRPPFLVGEVMAQTAVDLPKVPQLSHATIRVLAKALAPQPSGRFDSCRTFVDALCHSAETADAARSHAVARPEIHEAETVKLPLSSMGPRAKRIGELLVEAKVISREQLEEALLQQKGQRDKLGAMLFRLGYASEDSILRALSDQLDLPIIDLRDTRIDPSVAKLITRPIAEYKRILPLYVEEGNLYVAMNDPLDLQALAELEEKTGATAQPLIAREADLLDAIQRVFGSA